jgi:hypothetical protein
MLQNNNIRIFDILNFIRLKQIFVTTAIGERIHDYVPFDNHDLQVAFCEKTQEFVIDFLNGKDDEIVKNIQRYIIDFINEMDYSEILISSVLNNYYVVETVFIDEQFGDIYNKLIKENSSFELNFQIALNGLLYLLNYIYSNLTIPEDISLQQIIINYKNKLVNDNYYISEIDNDKINKVSITIYDPFRKFRFFIRILEHDCHKLLLLDSSKIENYLNENLCKYNFGESVKDIYFWYSILKSKKIKKNYILNEIENYEYEQDMKIMYITGHYDRRKLRECKKAEKKNKIYNKCAIYNQIKYFHQGILKSILKINEMKNKPKDFNTKYFYEIIDKLLNEYEENIIYS